MTDLQNKIQRPAINKREAFWVLFWDARSLFMSPDDRETLGNPSPSKLGIMRVIGPVAALPMLLAGIYVLVWMHPSNKLMAILVIVPFITLAAVCKAMFQLLML